MARYDAMIAAIAECHRVDEAKTIHDKALAMELYAKQAMNLDAERKATDIRLRAEKRAGKLFRELKRSPGSKGGDVKSASHRGKPKSKSEYAETLARTGVSFQTANRWQELADVPDETFAKPRYKIPPSSRRRRGLLPNRNQQSLRLPGCRRWMMMCCGCGGNYANSSGWACSRAMRTSCMRRCSLRCRLIVGGSRRWCATGSLRYGKDAHETTPSSPSGAAEIVAYRSILSDVFARDTPIFAVRMERERRS